MFEKNLSCVKYQELTRVPENWFGPSDGKTSKLFLDRVIDEQFLHASKNPD